jgi:tetratricopeptide (TPR) repeat protein
MWKRVISMFFGVLLLGQVSAAQTVSGLLDELALAPSEPAAQKLVNQIWNEWIYPDTEIDHHSTMEIGIEAMRANALEHAERIFTKLLERAPQYTEAWNKRATIRFMRGDMTGSEADIYQVLTREPRHFGAIAGLGMINIKFREFDKALNAYERVIKINPYSPDAKVIIPDLKDALGIVDL